MAPGAAGIDRRLWRLGARPAALAGATLWAVGLLVATGPAAYGQRDPVHYFHSADLPPGTIGPGQLLRGGPLAGYVQPVEIRVPAGSTVSVAVDGQFQPPQKGSVLVGMLIGPVYPVKVMGIHLQADGEVFPTVELINRLYPPPGLASHFPVPIDISEEELRLAVSGRFVTRVIYLEDPNEALPVRDRPRTQRFVDVLSDEDPLQAADRLGRPMAILRMGSRTPELDAAGRMTVPSPPLVLLPKPQPLQPLKAGLEPPPPPPPAGPGKNPPRLPVRSGWHGGPVQFEVK